VRCSTISAKNASASLPLRARLMAAPSRKKERCSKAPTDIVGRRRQVRQSSDSSRIGPW
jgi:hypothetical protein